MKKLLSLALVLVLVLSMAVTASATTTKTFRNDADPKQELPYSDDAEVYVTVEGTINPVYYVTVTWKSLEFSFAGAGTQWDPEAHIYKAVTGSWISDIITDAVVVANHSNADLYCTFTQTDFPDGDNLTVGLSNTTTTKMESAYTHALGDFNKAATAKTNVTINGTPDKEWIGDGNSHQVATISATITLNSI